MKYYIAAHDFTAEEEVELSVEKGEVLCASEGIVQDGWVKVEVITDARRRGFVPQSYLNELTAAEAMAFLEATSNASGKAAASTSLTHTPRQADRNTASSTVSTSLDVGSRSAVLPQKEQSPSPRAGPRSPDGGSAAAATAPTNSPRVTCAAETRPLTPAQQATGPVNRHLLENPNAAVDAFMKNEVYFKQLMQRRAAALAQMQSGIEEAMTEVAACKDRNAVLTRKLRDLDEVVERERARWMSRVKEEKTHVSRAAPYSSAMAVPVSSGTTPVRSPISGRQGGPGRSVLEDNTPRQLRA
ncbi:SH3 domain protein-like protein [Lotmaria passim]